MLLETELAGRNCGKSTLLCLMTLAHVDSMVSNSRCSLWKMPSFKLEKLINPHIHCLKSGTKTENKSLSCF